LLLKGKRLIFVRARACPYGCHIPSGILTGMNTSISSLSDQPSIAGRICILAALVALGARPSLPAAETLQYPALQGPLRGSSHQPALLHRWVGQGHLSDRFAHLE
jgi:hypothetical protein